MKTIPERCSLLYIPTGSNLHSLGVDSHFGRIAKALLLNAVSLLSALDTFRYMEVETLGSVILGLVEVEVKSVTKYS